MEKIENPEIIELLTQLYHMYGVLNAFSFREVIHYNKDLIFRLDENYRKRLQNILHRLTELEGNERLNELLYKPEIWMEQFGLPNHIILN